MKRIDMCTCLSLKIDCFTKLLLLNRLFNGTVKIKSKVAFGNNSIYFHEVLHYTCILYIDITYIIKCKNLFHKSNFTKQTLANIIHNIYFDIEISL